MNDDRPSLDDVERLARSVLSRITIGRVLTGATIGVLVVAVATCWFTVQPDETAVVLRFGRMVRTVGPGLHGRLPLWIESVHLLPTARVLKEEFGFRTVEPGRRSKFQKGPQSEESLILTGDLNVIDVEWIVQYRIADPALYLFSVREPRDALRDVSESVMRRVVGNRPGSEVLTSARTAVAKDVREEVQRVLAEYRTGIHVITVELQDVTPPETVRPAFNEVNEARQDRERTINQAQEQANRQLPKARGEAAKVIAEAEGHARERVNQALGDASHFRSLLGAYRSSPVVTRGRLYLESMKDVLLGARAVYVMDPAMRSVLPWLPLQSPRGVDPVAPVPPIFDPAAPDSGTTAKEGKS